jgi:hypothetical protein
MKMVLRVVLGALGRFKRTVFVDLPNFYFFIGRLISLPINSFSPTKFHNYLPIFIFTVPTKFIILIIFPNKLTTIPGNNNEIILVYSLIVYECKNFSRSTNFYRTS